MDMSMDDDDDDNGGGAGWVTTFADLMSLLMCFFVLLLSFSEMDVQKYRQLAGSLKSAFGSQRMMRIDTLPKSSSAVKANETPGNPDRLQPKLTPQQPTAQQGAGELSEAQLAQLEDQVQSEAASLKRSLKKEVQSGQVEVVTDGMWIVVRVTEKGSFPSGGAEIDPAFQPVLSRIRKSLRKIEGNITVEGHTDDVPIQTSRYRSNWELSASRAVSVAHELLKDPHIDKNRMSVAGLGSTRPLVKGTSQQARSRNRRVEVVIRRMDELVRQQAEALKKASGQDIKVREKVKPEDRPKNFLERVSAETAGRGYSGRPRVDPAQLER